MSSPNNKTESVESNYDEEEAKEMVCEAFDESKKREDDAFEEYTLKMQREQQRQQFLLDEKIKSKVYATIRSKKAEKRAAKVLEEEG